MSPAEEVTHDNRVAVIQCVKHGGSVGCSARTLRRHCEEKTQRTRVWHLQGMGPAGFGKMMLNVDAGPSFEKNTLLKLSGIDNMFWGNL